MNKQTERLKAMLSFLVHFESPGSASEKSVLY